MRSPAECSTICWVLKSEHKAFTRDLRGYPRRLNREGIYHLCTAQNVEKSYLRAHSFAQAAGAASALRQSRPRPKTQAAMTRIFHQQNSKPHRQHHNRSHRQHHSKPSRLFPMKKSNVPNAARPDVCRNISRMFPGAVTGAARVPWVP